MGLFGALPRNSPSSPRNSPSLGSGNLDELESELGGLPFELSDLQLPVLSLVEGRSFVHVLHSVAQHAVDQAGQLGRHGLDRDRSQFCPAELASCALL